MAAAAWSCVEKMLHELQVTSAPRRPKFRLVRQSGSSCEGILQFARPSRVARSRTLHVTTLSRAFRPRQVRFPFFPSPPRRYPLLYRVQMQQFWFPSSFYFLLSLLSI